MPCLLVTQLGAGVCAMYLVSQSTLIASTSPLNIKSFFVCAKLCSFFFSLSFLLKFWDEKHLEIDTLGNPCFFYFFFNSITIKEKCEGVSFYVNFTVFSIIPIPSVLLEKRGIGLCALGIKPFFWKPPFRNLPVPTKEHKNKKAERAYRPSCGLEGRMFNGAERNSQKLPSMADYSNSYSHHGCIEYGSDILRNAMLQVKWG